MSNQEKLVAEEEGKITPEDEVESMQEVQPDQAEESGVDENRSRDSMERTGVY